MLLWHHRHRHEMKSARQEYICRSFYFTSLRLSIKALEIDDRTIKRSKLVYISVL
jgi:hypothetical protein